MTDNEKQFENFVSGIKFDDTPDPNHRDKLEQNLLDALAKQSRQRPQSFKIWRTIMNSRMTKLSAAAAALIILAIGFFMIHLGPGEKVDTAEVPQVTKSPAEMLTVASLSIAYRKGGLEAIEAQFDKALEKLGPRPAKITVKELLAEFNGT